MFSFTEPPSVQLTIDNTAIGAGSNKVQGDAQYILNIKNLGKNNYTFNIEEATDDTFVTFASELCKMYNFTTQLDKNCNDIAIIDKFDNLYGKNVLKMIKRGKQKKCVLIFKIPQTEVKIFLILSRKKGDGYTHGVFFINTPDDNIQLTSDEENKQIILTPHTEEKANVANVVLIGAIPAQEAKDQEVKDQDFDKLLDLFDQVVLPPIDKGSPEEKEIQQYSAILQAFIETLDDGNPEAGAGE
jgi:hypothetical protein